ncbi:LOG family protein [Fervidicoccus fontis]|uniref:LOG family protein n=1 Tax=Fervidicoccus fontis TaxID=683846 RepID=A0A843AII0_9CREN|nr:LOG family protein [Fervidicoccus fontis]MBE9390781.1 LOG family protein [Fervidicoccus fontis]
MKISVSISAYSSEPDEEHKDKAMKFLEEFDTRSERWISFYALGGYRGLMKYAADLLLSRGRKVVMILPLEYEDENIPEDVIKIKAGTTFTNRNIIMVRSGDALLCLGGGLGSITEIVNALAMGKLAIVLRGTGALTDSLEKSLEEGEVDPRKGGVLKYVETAGEAIEVIENHFKLRNEILK